MKQPKMLINTTTTTNTTKNTFTLMQRLMLLLLLCLITLQFESNCRVDAWMPDVRPDLQLKQEKIIARFIGNSTDYFKILDHNDATILVGAKDVIYNISLHNLRENNHLEWNSSAADRELCALKGKSESDCHNYLRVFARLPNDEILLCGTNSYKPRCRHYAPTMMTSAGDEEVTRKVGISAGMQYEITRDVEAPGLCPYSPAHNSTYIFADGQLYSATMADFSGNDPLIYRENLRTEQYDLNQLNQPDFVGTIEHNGYVMFFFRELSMEYRNLGKAVYSRVARVCKNDRGGPYTHSKIWTSFLKARLNCSVPGEFPFYFNEIQAISPVIQSGRNSLVYAVFTTSVNAIPGSAVCAFNVDDIIATFDNDIQSEKDTHMQRAGKCVEDSRILTSIAVDYIKKHPLMDSAVPAVYARPLLTKVNLHHRLTAIAVEAQIQALNGITYDLIYTGTDDGKVTKFINIPTPSNAEDPSAYVEKLQTIVISEMQVLPLGTPIRELVVSSKTNTLLVVSDGSLVTVPLHRCMDIIDCASCLSLQDPNCAWDKTNRECKFLTTASNHKFGTKSYIQSLNTTKKAAVALCPKIVRNNDVPTVTFDENLPQIPLTIEEKLTKFHYASVSAVNTAVKEGDSLPELNSQANGNGDDFLQNDFGDDNNIPMHAVDPDQMMTALNDAQRSVSVQRKDVYAAGKNLSWFYWVLSLAAFILGLVFGAIYKSHKHCKAMDTHGAHRNEFNPKSQCIQKLHNGGKSVNLLLGGSNIYSNTQKKANLDLEKDRSHECKNSTENLEKEYPCKTSTLTKVKSTYI